MKTNPILHRESIQNCNTETELIYLSYFTAYGLGGGMEEYKAVYKQRSESTVPQSPPAHSAPAKFTSNFTHSENSSALKMWNIRFAFTCIAFAFLIFDLVRFSVPQDYFTNCKPPLTIGQCVRPVYLLLGEL